MAQLVEQEKQISPRLAHYLAEYRRSVEQADAAAPLGGAGPRERNRPIRASRLSDHEDRTVAVHQRRTDRRAHVRPRDRQRRTGGAAGTAARQSDRARCLREWPVRAAVVAISTSCPKGVQVLGLEATLASQPSLVEPYLAKLSLTQTSAFTSLNTAFLRDGVVVVIPARVVRRAADRNYVCLDVRERRLGIASPPADCRRRGIAGHCARTLCRTGRCVHQRGGGSLARRQRRGRSLQAAGRGRGGIPHRQHVSARRARRHVLVALAHVRRPPRPQRRRSPRSTARASTAR